VTIPDGRWYDVSFSLGSFPYLSFLTNRIGCESRYAGTPENRRVTCGRSFLRRVRFSFSIRHPNVIDMWSHSGSRGLPKVEEDQNKSYVQKGVQSLHGLDPHQSGRFPAPTMPENPTYTCLFFVQLFGC